MENSKSVYTGVIALFIGAALLGSSAIFVRISETSPSLTAFYRAFLALPFLYIWVLNSKTEYSCIINADGSMDPKYLNSMLENCVTKDFIFASRDEKLGGGSDDDTIITLIGNKIFSFLGNAIFDLKISDILYTYVLGKTDSFKKLQLNHRDFRLCVELPIKAKIVKRREL